MMTTPTDPLYASQWHFSLIGDIETIWDEFNGDSVHVGVYDDGIDLTHEDLAPNYDASRHVVDGSLNPVVPVHDADGGHGTATAGLIGAANNGLGGVGVAWGTHLTAVNIFNPTLYGYVNDSTPDEFMDVVHQAAGLFDVTSHSWGATPVHGTGQDLANASSFAGRLNAEYAYISANGRGGLGTIVVQAAGNDNRDSNGDGVNASRFTITVAATEQDGFASPYSNYGTAILVTAPAAAVTTDIGGDMPHPFDSLNAGTFSAPGFVDFDNDGDMDMVSGTANGTLRAYANNGSNVFTEVVGAANPFNGVDLGDYSFVSFGDIDSDGDKDLVTGSDDGLLHTFANNGAGAFTELSGVANPFNGIDVGNGSATALADFNGDGKVDLLTGISTGLFRAFTGNGSGVFTEVTGGANPFSAFDAGSYSTPAFGDIDGDGDVDMVAGNEAGQLSTFLNSGGVFTLQLGAANPFDGVDIGTYSAPALYDFDSDGDLDLVSGNGAGTFNAFRNDGGLVFTEMLQFGYDPTSYTHSFNGTSAATPVVSGVVTLMLDANAELGWRDVQDILANSATLTGSAFDAVAPSSTEEGFWQSNSSGNWNGGGNHIHFSYGYGMVNAYNAVRMAEVWTLFAPAETSANEVTSVNVNDFADVLLPDNNSTGFTTTFTVTDDLNIDHLALHLDVQSASMRNLAITLTSAEGTVITVALGGASPTPWNNTLYNVAHTGDWIWAIDQLRGELTAGTWTLQVADTVSGSSNTVRSATLEFFGSNAGVDDVYHLTSEYLAMVGFESSRGVIEDTNGGVDWINMAAVADAVSIDMANGQTFAVGGVNWGTLAGAFENLVTSDGDDTIVGNALANAIHGMRGNDSIIGGNEGSITLHDSLYGGAGNDTLNGGQSDDACYGGTGNDLFRVTDDQFADSVYGGDGNDRLDLTDPSATDAFDVNLTINIYRYVGDPYGPHAVYDIFGVENVTGSKNNDIIVGDGQNNALDGATGNDTVDGAGGNDTLTGGDGNDSLTGGSGTNSFDGGIGDDTYVVSSFSDTFADASGTDTIQTALSSFSIFSKTMIENLTGTSGSAQTLTGNVGNNGITGAAGNDTLIGGDGNDTLTGNNGNDSLDGGSGTNTMDGGGGNDTYEVSSFSDVLTDASGEDTVKTSLSSYSIFSKTFIEHLTGTVNTGQTLTGNIGNNRITAAGGNDSLIGSEGNDSLFGNGGNDTLNGGTGTNALDGGSGNDTYVVASFTDTFADASGTDTVQTSLSAFSIFSKTMIENLTGTTGAGQSLTGNIGNNVITASSGNDTLVGSDGNDSLFGNNGNDRLDGGSGTNALDGGAGNDTYVVSSFSDTFTDASGTDTVQTSLSSYSIFSKTMIENLTGTSGAGQTLTGNTGNNAITGAGGNDTLLGSGGNDSLFGNGGNDRLEGGSGTNALDGGAGDDTYVVSSFSDTFTDASGTDTVETSLGAFSIFTKTMIENLTGTASTGQTLTGNSGNNVITGGTGSDTLVGGAGLDTFVFNKAITVSNVDTISGFSVVDDIFRLDHSIFTGMGSNTLLGLAAFAANNTGLAGDATDRIIYQLTTGQLFFDVDGLGGVAGKLFAVIDPNLLTLGNGDFFIA